LAAGIDGTTPERLPGRHQSPFGAKARLWFSRAIKHSILQELLPTVVTTNNPKVTPGLKEMLARTDFKN
jgi:hypothetical protein